MNEDAFLPPGFRPIGAPVPSPKPTPLTIILRRFFDNASALLKNQTLSRDHLQTWMSMVRNQLAKIYGKDGPQLAHFPSLPHKLSQTSVRTTLVERRQHLQRIIEGLEDLVDATQTPLVRKQIFIGRWVPLALSSLASGCRCVAL